MQTVLVILVLSAAVVYLGYRAFGVLGRKKQKGCEKCGIGGKQVDPSSTAD